MAFRETYLYHDIYRLGWQHPRKVFFDGEVLENLPWYCLEDSYRPYEKSNSRVVLVGFSFSRVPFSLLYVVFFAWSIPIFPLWSLALKVWPIFKRVIFGDNSIILTTYVLQARQLSVIYGSWRCTNAANHTLGTVPIEKKAVDCVVTINSCCIAVYCWSHVSSNAGRCQKPATRDDQSPDAGTVCRVQGQGRNLQDSPQ